MEKKGLPKDWNKGIITPIFKRGEKKDVKNYRGITLIDTAYKIYTSILNEKLKEEAEEKLQETQFRFREERGTMDAVYVMNHIINKELKKKGEKVFAFFADLKVTFDKVDRRELNDMIKSIEISDHLRGRVT